MGKYHGKSAKVLLSSTEIPQLTGWTCNVNAATADSTSVHATNKGRTRTSGFKSGTATATAYAGLTQATTIGATVLLKLYRTAAIIAYQGNAVCTNISNGTDEAGNATVTYSFTWKGAVTKP